MSVLKPLLGISHALIYTIAFVLCSSCGVGMPDKESQRDSIASIRIDRFDQLQYRYVTTCDYSALQQMSLLYPTETRTLIEDVLGIGRATDLNINATLLQFYQDSIMQQVSRDAELQYEDMSDVEHSLRSSFTTLHKLFPDLPLPSFYAQIGALQQSVIVNDTRIGICLEKYLGADYPLYIRFYTASQRAMMNRAFIVGDCLCFYLLSRYGLSMFDTREQWERDMYIAKIQWVANRCLSTPLYKSEELKHVEKYMRHYHNITAQELVASDNLSALRDIK